jgi:hypothetical protein
MRNIRVEIQILIGSFPVQLNKQFLRKLIKTPSPDALSEELIIEDLTISPPGFVGS